MLLGHGLWVLLSLSLPLNLAVVVVVVVGARTPLLPSPALRHTLLSWNIPSNAICHVVRPTTAAALICTPSPSLYSRVLSSSRGPSMAGIATIEIDSSARRTSSPRSSELLPSTSRPVDIYSPLA